jgi:hypothetical protein
MIAKSSVLTALTRILGFYQFNAHCLVTGVWQFQDNARLAGRFE